MDAEATSGMEGEEAVTGEQERGGNDVSSLEDSEEEELEEGEGEGEGRSALLQLGRKEEALASEAIRYAASSALGSRGHVEGAD